MTDKREAEFMWWHTAVFGPKPWKERIPFHVMRDYQDLQRELSRARDGVDYFILNMSIQEIKERANAK